MTINELDRLLDEALSPITEKRPNIEKDISQKFTSKEKLENEETEDEPRKITVRFIKKLD